MWLTAGGGAFARWPGQVTFIHSALGEIAIQIQEARPGFAEITRERRQHRAGAHDVSARS